MKRVGGLWIKNSKKDDKKYLTGTLTLKVLMFKADNKKSSKSPDFSVYIDTTEAPKLAFKQPVVTQEDFL